MKKRRVNLYQEYYQAVVAYLEERDGPLCALCGGSFLGGDLTVDHIIAVADGGQNVLTNFRLAHNSCNTRKYIAEHPDHTDGLKDYWRNKKEQLEDYLKERKASKGY
jgi:5-methylcytosine-specific restriction endonuclease McrA